MGALSHKNDTGDNRESHIACNPLSAQEFLRQIGGNIAAHQKCVCMFAATVFETEFTGLTARLDASRFA